MRRLWLFILLLLSFCWLTGCARSAGRMPAPISAPGLTQPPTQLVVPTAPATPTAAPVSTPGDGTAIQVQTRLAWFYKPPRSGNLEAVAQAYQFFILTRMDERERDVLRGLGVEAPILQYLLFDEVQDPGSCSEHPNHNQVAEETGDFCELSRQHADWFLRGADGTGLSNDDGYCLMDPGNSAWRAYWLERARNSQENLGWQGVFLDNVEASLEKRSQYGNLPVDYPDDASYQAAIEDNLRFLYTTYFQPEGRPLFANIIALEDRDVWFRYLQYLDGAMIEDFAAGWNGDYPNAYEWEAQLELAEQTQAKGKQILLVSQGDEFDHARETYSLASYLLVNNGNAFFRYSNASAYDENWNYDNTSLQFGAALGARYQVGSTWVRDFERGRVWVDPNTRTAGIELTQ